MIIASGTVQYKLTEQADEYDDNGYPQAPRSQWSQAVPAQVVLVEYDHTALSSVTDTPIIIARYEVLVEARHYIEADEIRITDYRSKATEELRVVSAEYLRAVGQYKILCR